MNVYVKSMLLSMFIITCIMGSGSELDKASVLSNVSMLHSIDDGQRAYDISTWKEYSNAKYKITFKYPSDWKVNKEFTERYDGKDGFFQVASISNPILSIDKIAEEEGHHIAQPYGSNPKINKLKIQGLETRLILPSEDQPKELKGQSAIIVQYPKPVKIGSLTYNYFILWADKEHIEEIGKTIKFY